VISQSYYMKLIRKAR